MPKRQNEGRSRVRRLTLAAMMTALSVTVLYLGALFDVMSLSAAGIASLFTLLTVRECRGAYPYFVYAATAILSFLLLPQKEAALLYVLLGGFYPIVKFPLEHLRRPFPLLLKLFYLNFVVTAVELLSIWLFYLPPMPLPYYLVLYLIANPAFFLYDRLLDKLLVLYEAKWRPRIANYLP